MDVPEFSPEDVQRAIGEIGEFLASDGVMKVAREEVLQDLPSVDPIPPPPDPTGITICVELCLPG